MDSNWGPVGIPFGLGLDVRLRNEPFSISELDDHEFFLRPLNMDFS